MENTKLTFANQLKFKVWAKKKGLNPDWYYFDNVSVVDAKDLCFCPDIPGILANGKYRWDKAFQVISGYFKNRNR